MESVTIVVPASPVPFARAGSVGKRRFTPTRQANFMGVIRLYAERAMAGRAPFDGAVRVEAAFFYVRPPSWSKKKSAAVVWKTSAPDIDNLFKIVADSINGCVFLDDAQISSLAIHKKYGTHAEIVVTVTPLENGP